MAQAPLTSLCSICYTNPPKYRCPRCSTIRYCSLPCYKRHQQRASCSGKRDPGAYVKKSQLSTAAGIDHDFNFLSNIERALDHKDEENQGRGTSGRKGWHRNAPLQKYLIDNHITVHLAPVGFSRQKNNHTRFLPKSKRIVWTVEWSDEHDEKRSTEVHEHTTLGDAYASMLAQKERASNKRKRDHVDDEIHVSSAHARPTKDVEEASTAPVPALESIRPSALQEQHVHDQSDPPPDGEQLEHQSSSRPAPEQRSLQPSSSKPSHHLYLLRPKTNRSAKVLHPLDPSQTLTTALQGRQVLEYPTIYVLSHSPINLPGGFVNEETWLKSSETGRSENARAHHGGGAIDINGLPYGVAAYGQSQGQGSREREKYSKSSGMGTGANSAPQASGRRERRDDAQDDNDDGEGREERLDPGAILDMLRRDVPS